MNEQKSLLAKWLRYLFYLHIVSLVISAVNAVTGLESFTQWLSGAVSIGAVFCLFRLQAVNPRYRKSAIFQAAALGSGLMVTLVGGLGLLGTVASVCGILAAYQEYHGHSELVAEANERLSRKWAGLFLWSLALGIVSGFGATAAVVIGVVAEMDTALITNAAVVLVLLTGGIVEILYLRYMKRTLGLLDNRINQED